MYDTRRILRWVLCSVVLALGASEVGAGTFQVYLWNVGHTAIAKWKSTEWITRQDGYVLEPMSQLTGGVVNPGSTVAVGSSVNGPARSARLRVALANLS